jgi:hypothetical protein
MAAAGLVGAPAASHAARATQPWPPATGPGLLFAHFGEEHYNDADGGTILPTVVGSVAAYKPVLTTMSGDKGNDGEVEQLSAWKAVMARLDAAGAPYFAAVGNHDRNAPPGVPGGTIGLVGGTTPESIENYRETFQDRPYPMGDGAPYADPRIGPRVRPAGDPAGAATHYAVDVDRVRWIFLDNSCWTLSTCDPFQVAADRPAATQLTFLREQAAEATAAGRTVFVVMHMPTQDPRDQSYTDFTARNHVMGKGATTDNAVFEQTAEETGVDGVFLGHIKGQFSYRGLGGIPYYIDGGAGGELYTTGPVGTDHGYWHGFRLVRVDGAMITTDTVPVFVHDGITIAGPKSVALGATGTFAATGRQPVFNDPAKVDALQLRDPAPVPPRAFATLRGSQAIALARAEEATPTTTPREDLPTPAHIWTTRNDRVLAPAAVQGDDPRRDPATQTGSGRFVARCPGTTTVDVTSGWETSGIAVTVPSAKGRLVRRVSRGARSLRRGSTVRVAGVRLAQPAVVRVRVTQGGKLIRTLLHRCASTKPLPIRWSGAEARRGTALVSVTVFSDRKPQTTRFAVRVR